MPDDHLENQSEAREDLLDPQLPLRSLRLLTEALHAFTAMNRAELRQYGLTPAQFDIVATLGRTEGMTFSQLGEKTLITKGTLTGVVDRLVRSGLAERVSGQADRRTILVRLTAAGEEMFARLHPRLLTRVQHLFAGQGYREADLLAMNKALTRLRNCFETGLKMTEPDQCEPIEQSAQTQTTGNF